MGFAHGGQEGFEALHVFRSPLLVADTHHLEIEWGGMAHLRTQRAPGSCCVAIGELHEVERVLDVRGERVDGHVVLRAVVLILAGEAYVEHRKRLGADFLREQEIFIETKAVALEIVGEEMVGEGVVPAVFDGRSVLDGADGVFPLVAGVEVGSLYDAAAGETEHAGMYVGQFLGEVFAQAVFMPFPGVDGEER